MPKRKARKKVVKAIEGADVVASAHLHELAEKFKAIEEIKLLGGRLAYILKRYDENADSLNDALECLTAGEKICKIMDGLEKIEALETAGEGTFDMSIPGFSDGDIPVTIVQDEVVEA